MGMMFLEKETMDDIDKLREILENSFILNKNCWEWPAAKNHGGYGTFRGYLVHRVSYAIFVQNFRRSSFICHRCDNPKCYNPAHLYEGDSKSNASDMKATGRRKYNKLYKTQ